MENKLPKTLYLYLPRNRSTMKGYPSIKFALILFSYFLIGCGNSSNKKTDITNLGLFGAQSELSGEDKLLLEQAFIKTRMELIKTYLSKDIPVIPCQEKLSAPQLKAQEIALQDAEFVKFTRDVKTKSPMRNEVFAVYGARPGDFDAKKESVCADGSCYRVEMYNYALNLSTIGLIHLNSGKVLRTEHLPQFQPEIPANLKQLALDIAFNSADVEKALGFKPSAKQAVMSSTKTALNNSKCERSQHLCVAPTFLKDDKALWCIVDLTEHRLVGLRWTQVGKQEMPEMDYSLTERKLQNEKLTECYCKKSQNLKNMGWDMNYIITSSDGLRISEVKFNNKPILSSAKLVDWHVSYSNTEGFGYSDAVGCPVFSSAAVVAVEAPIVAELKENGTTVGFVLEQKYYSEGWPRACNYNYMQRYEFYKDGRFRIACASLGRGCGDNGTYRPVMRIVPAGNFNFETFSKASWQKQTKESYFLQDASSEYADKGMLYKISGTSNSFGIVPGNGQFGDKGRGDNAWIFVSKLTPGKDEGESELPTIGPCCNTDFRQGPEKFILPNPESIENSAIVLWYVPQLKNDNTKGNEYCWAEAYLENGIYKTKTYPCIAGPMFIPIQ